MLFQPDTIVVGSKRVEAFTGPDGRKIPAHWEYGKVERTITHWASEGDKREAGGDRANAKPFQLSTVYIFRGMGARHANEVRHDILRRRRGEERPWKRGVR